MLYKTVKSEVITPDSINEISTSIKKRIKVP
ncbi:unnamed protein product, partial [Rotaria magnacalcarata]